jgi:hypothetical protein
MNVIVITREECPEPAPVKLVVECDPVTVTLPEISDETATLFAYLTDDTLRRVHDALVMEWLMNYNGPRDRNGKLLMDGYHYTECSPVFKDDVTWNKALEDDDLRRVTEDFINRVLLMRERIAQGNAS